MNVAVATRMTVDELGLALGMYCKLHGDDARVPARHLDVTPRAHFDEARVWAESNAKVIALLGSDPAAVAAGAYSLSEARGWLSRLLGLGRTKGATAPADDELAALCDLQVGDLRSRERKIDPEKARELEAIRELVDDSFDSA